MGGESSEVIRKLERLLGHSHEELMEIGRQRRQQTQSNPGKRKIIGHFTYDFEKQTEKFTPTLKYRIRTSFNRLYSNVYSYFHPKKDNYK